MIASARLVRALAVATVLSFGVLAFPAAWLMIVVVDVMLLLAAALDWLITPPASALAATRLAPERLSVLEEHSVTVVVRNNSRLRLAVRMRDGLPQSFTSSTNQVFGVVAGQGEAHLCYRVRPRARGRFTWGTLELRYRSLLGLWERGKRIAAADDVRVYPSVAALARYHLLARAQRLDTLGIRKVRTRGAAWEFESLRDYVAGDDVRLIDWKATARRRKAIVRNQEAERNQTILLLVDSGRLMNAEVEGVAKLDHAVNTSLVLAHVALIRGDRVGLCAFSSQVHTWVTPRARRGQIRLLTEALYDLRGDYTESDHGRCLRLVAARHPKRSLLIVLTDFVDAETASDMVAYLRRAARRHVVLFAALKDPQLEQMADAFPQTELAGFEKCAATELLRERRAVLEQLRQLGAYVLDVEPSGLTPPIINRYLEIAARGIL